MVKLLVDPAILIPEVGTTEIKDFWLRFFEWCKDDRILLGARTHEIMVQWCSDTVWGDEKFQIPKFLEREIAREVNNVLGRRPFPHEILADEEMVSLPAYISKVEGGGRSLFADVRGTELENIGAIATRIESWASSSHSIELDVVDGNVEVHFSPNLIMKSEKVEIIREFYRDRKIAIVGGKRCQNVLKCLKEDLSIEEGNVIGIESELNKPPRDLSKKISMMDLSSNHLVFVWGRVGHESFEPVQKLCSRAGYELIYPQFVSQIVSELKDRALRPR